MAKVKSPMLSEADVRYLTAKHAHQSRQMQSYEPTPGHYDKTVRFLNIGGDIPDSCLFKFNF